MLLPKHAQFPVGRQLSERGSSGSSGSWTGQARRAGPQSLPTGMSTDFKKAVTALKAAATADALGKRGDHAQLCTAALKYMEGVAWIDKACSAPATQPKVAEALTKKKVTCVAKLDAIKAQLSDEEWKAAQDACDGAMKGGGAPAATAAAPAAAAGGGAASGLASKAKAAAAPSSSDPPLKQAIAVLKLAAAADSLGKRGDKAKQVESVGLWTHGTKIIKLVLADEAVGHRPPNPPTPALSHVLVAED